MSGKILSPDEKITLIKHFIQTDEGFLKLAQSIKINEDNCKVLGKDSTAKYDCINYLQIIGGDKLGDFLVEKLENMLKQIPVK